jgi:CBS domain containing-hemolysin-like protein
VILAAVLLGLVCLSAFFGLCETAFSCASRIKIKNMAAKSKRARLTLKLLDSYDKVLSSVILGNNISNIAASALATMLFLELFGAKGVSIATAVMTVTIVVFGDVSPKTLAKEAPEQNALRCAPVLRFFIIIFSPLNYLFGLLKKVIVRIFPAKLDRSVTEDELLTFVEEVRQEGGINQQEELMIRQVIEFDDITAAEIITPRVDLAAVSENDSAGDIEKLFMETGFSRLPVYRENIDNITGVILLKDFHHEVAKKGRRPAEIVKPVVYAAKTIKITRLLRTLQEKQSHMAVLVDEFGGTLGIVTVEDIVEELVGEIWDEHDEKVEPFRQNADGSFTVLGSANLQDMLEFLGSHIPGGFAGKDEAVPSTTVGNWVMEHLGGMHRVWEPFEWRNLRIRVSRVQRHRVLEVTVSAPENPGQGPR